jgi:hypothetical protein
MIALPVGKSRIIIGKGPEFHPEMFVADLVEAGTTNVLNVQLKPVLDLYKRGWRGGDAHIHFFHGDNQVARTPEEVYRICSAGGLNWVSLAGEHYGAGQLSRIEVLERWRALERPDCQVWLGSEAPKSAWGHFATVVTDPWSVSDALPYSNGIKDVHAQGGISFPVHPDRLFPFRRSFDGGYYFYPLNNHSKFLPLSALAGHLLDGWSAISDQPSSPHLLNTYQKLLRMGYKIPLLSDSDNCMDRVNNGLKVPGFWINYVHTGEQPLTRAAIATGIRGGRVMATTGPLVLFSIDDQLPSSILEADGSSRRFRIEASYSFNPWTLSKSNFAGTAKCVLQSVELLRNGEVVRLWHPNEPNFVVEETLPIETEDCNYMVRVLGNEGVWMAGYASPIFLEAVPKPRHPPVFKPLINGRLYDATTGTPIQGTVSAERFGRTEWTIPTDAKGLFRARVPLDAALVARDGAGRELRRDWMNYEPAYVFGHYLPERYQDKATAIDDFRDLVREMNWEFPLGKQSPTSYIKRALEGAGLISDIEVLSAPPRLAGKQHTEIAMLLVDRTRVQHGDTLNYAVIVRTPGGGAPSETVQVQIGGWDPNFPRLYTRYGKLVAETRPGDLAAIGFGYYLLRGSVVVPSWVRNINASDGGLRLSATVRQHENVWEDAHLTFRIGRSKRELLVSTMWDGIPATWGGRGAGPCHFSREIAWKTRYPDFRNSIVQFRLNGELVTVHPLRDTSTVADADDALFEDHHYYDAQCEPENRDIPYRDAIRQQPAEPDFSEVPIADPTDVTPPMVAAMEPVHDSAVRSPVSFYFHVDDAGLSGAGSATLFLNDVQVGFPTTESPVVVKLSPGFYSWYVRASDLAGNVSTSAVKRFRVLTESGEEPPGGENRNTAVYVGEDRASGGSWKAKFGADGYKVISDLESIPSYVVFSSTGHSQWLWNENTSSPAALERASGSGRLAACYYATNPYDLRFSFEDEEARQVTFYFLDWDRMQREQRIEVLDARNGKTLGERVMRDFGNGIYQTWVLKGDVVVRIHPIKGNAVMSGIFFDSFTPRTEVQAPRISPEGGTHAAPVRVTITPALSSDVIFYTLNGSTPTEDSIQYSDPITISECATLRAIAVAPGLAASPVSLAQFNILPSTGQPATATFLGSDRTTKGNWKGTYGGAGHITVRDSVQLPASTFVKIDGNSEWTWSGPTTDPRVLVNANSSSRVPSCWYSSTSFEVDVKFEDEATHLISLYCLDWDHAERAQKIEILDGATRQVLHSHELQAFGEGIYTSYDINGHVTIRLTKLRSHNAVVSGIFFD